MISKVNEDKGIQQYLLNRPFEISNVQVILYIHDKNQKQALDPYISTAEISGNNLTYRIFAEKDGILVITSVIESYEDALKALN
jgi:hypothetical protein